MRQTAIGLLILVLVWLAPADRGRAAEASPKTQAGRGDAIFQQACALCHGAAYQGSPGTPPLVGPEFNFGWSEKSVGELVEYLKAMMPPGQGGVLTDVQYVELAAAISEANGIIRAADLPTDLTALKGVRIKP